MARHIATLTLLLSALPLLASLARPAAAEPSSGPGSPCVSRDGVTARDVQRAARRCADEGGSFRSRFRDPEDGAFDASGWLASSTGFLPVPIIITEPAVGLGGGMVFGFFHDTNKGADGQVKTGPDGKPVPPSVSALGGLATENGTWGAFAGHMGVWNDDRIRYTGGGGYVSVNLDYYGLASEITGKPLSFNIEGFAILQDIKFRIANTPLFVGVRYAYFQNEVTLDKLLPIPGIEPPELDSKNAGAALEVMWDSRDNIFSPNNGVLAQATTTFYEPGLGGDFSYIGVEAYVLAWKQVLPCLNAGLRLDYQFADTGAPFYAQPFVQLRGIPAMRYQGNDVLVAEAELRFDVTQRWSLVGFGGVGRATKDLSDLPKFFERRGEAENVWNVGGGFRYLFARALGLRMGIDIARGPEDWAFYITVGSAWLKF